MLAGEFVGVRWDPEGVNSTGILRLPRIKLHYIGSSLLPGAINVQLGEINVQLGEINVLLGAINVQLGAINVRFSAINKRLVGSVAPQCGSFCSLTIEV